MNRNVYDLSLEELRTFTLELNEYYKTKLATNMENETRESKQYATTTAMNTDNELEFSIPKKTVKRKKIEPEPLLPTENIYCNLENENSFNENEPEEEEIKTNDTNSKPQKIAPIFLKEKEKWTQVSKLMKTRKINFTKCKMVATGVQINPATEEDYRKLNHALEKEKMQFYTYQLRSEKKLKVVIRGLIQELTEAEIKEDLSYMGYPVGKVTRMRNKLQKPIPLVLVEIDREYKSIYDLTLCCDLSVIVEPLRSRSGIIQCHKCQMFGHAQKNCHIQYKCMKCGEEHSTHECKKPKTTPPKCANCGGEHLSTYLKCNKNPNNPANKSKQETETNKENPWARKPEEAKKTEQINTNTQEKTKQTKSNETELAKTLGEMLILLHKTNASQEQKIEFLNKTETILKIFNSNDN